MLGLIFGRIAGLTRADEVLTLPRFFAAWARFGSGFLPENDGVGAMAGE